MFFKYYCNVKTYQKHNTGGIIFLVIIINFFLRTADRELQGYIF